ncbi:Protein of unknown function [Pyronema omphalodes CBS 100304]|uniref:Uncharacterized protein n=1 Tax=Pyronema omphalodes (strain CBS 100304) TaxID=1076935 RepID=U4KZR9_PYROM|nr:Protein of unknown function [Pyronema omphalodes CBS 100304]
MQSDRDTEFEQVERPPCVRKHEHPRPVLWGLLEPIVKELLSDPNYVRGLKVFQAEEFQGTFQYWANQVLQEAISMLFGKRRVLLWNLSTVITVDEYNKFCCYDCEIFSNAIRAFYGSLIQRPSTLGMIFIEDPKSGKSGNTECITKFIRGDTAEFEDDEDPQEVACQDAQEFWKNFRTALRAVGEI